MLPVATFDEIEREFIERVHSVVWCVAATVDTRGRPRTRILHPYWEGNTGWVTTRHNSPKIKHIAGNLHVSLAYAAEIFRPVYVECCAEWVGDLDERRRIWNTLRHAPPPMGFEPAETWGDIEDPDNGLLRLTPWRIEVNDYTAQPPQTKVWQA